MTIALPAPKGFTFGADPELFVKDETGKYVTAAGLIPGTKEEPHKVPNGAVQVDGMAAEFNIDPVSNFDDFERNITSVLESLKGFLPKGYDLVRLPSLSFTADAFMAAPEEAKILGCDPDFNAWTGQVNTPPDCADEPLLRCAGGHIHIGWTKDADAGDFQHVMHCRDLVKQLDWYLGAWSLKVDSDSNRRRLYGKAGAYRPKPYGVEYRVLSNFWLAGREIRIELWNRMISAINDMRTYAIADNSSFNDHLVLSINNSKMEGLLEVYHAFPINTLENPKSAKLSNASKYYKQFVEGTLTNG